MKVCIHTAEIKINGQDRRMLASLRRQDVLDQAKLWRREFSRPVRIESVIEEVERPGYE